MCGLAGGISTWLAPNEVEIVQHLGVMATFRGKIGGGAVIIPVKTKKDPLIFRHADTLAHILLSHEFAKETFNKDKKNSVIMCHARHPTKGDWDIKSTHPHVFGHIIGMHNGTFEEIRGTVLKKGDNDSQMFFEHVADEGIEMAVKYAKGAYALTWIDKRAETINFLRNDKRTLYFGHYDDDFSTLYWSSEAGMLHYVMNREKMDSSMAVKLRTVPENQLISMRLRNNDIIKPISVRPVKNYVTSVPVIVPETNIVPFVKPGEPPSDIPFSQRRINSEAPEYIKEEFNEAVLETKQHFWLPASRVEELVRTGCAACGTPAIMRDYWLKDGLIWYKPNEFICHKCWTTDGLARSYANHELGA